MTDTEHDKEENELDELQLPIAAETELPVIRFDFEETKTKLEALVSGFDHVVTLDGLQDSKKLATQLNKMKTKIDTYRKKIISEISAPIDAFDEQMKDLVIICSHARARITEQVSRFEDETKVRVRELLIQTRDELWSLHKVKEQFRSVQIEDLIKLGSITAKGNLSGSALTELENRVLNNRRNQDRTELRLHKAENASYKAGLKSALVFENIRSFLNVEDESAFDDQLSMLIGVEIERQDQATIRSRAASIRDQMIEEKASQSVGPVSHSAPASVAAGKVSYDVVCVFETTVAATIEPAKIEQRIRELLARVNIQSLKSISIRRAAAVEVNNV